MNRCVLIGNLGQDAELKVLGSGDSVLKFSLATTEKWKDRDGNQKERTEWHRCNLFGKRAESLAQYLTKGTKLAVEGSIQYGSYEKDGVKHYTTDIRVNNVEFVGGGKKQAAEDAAPNPPSDDDDIPF